MPDPFSFVRSRLDGQVSLNLMLGRDMALTGTLIKLLASVGALMLVAQGVGAGAALVVLFAPTPRNLFIVGASGVRLCAVAAMRSLQASGRRGQSHHLADRADHPRRDGRRDRRSSVCSRGSLAGLVRSCRN